jgi:ribosomal protein L11 methyltransferase
LVEGYLGHLMSPQKDPQGSWLEVSLAVDGEMAEAVAEVLARFALNGVVIEDQVDPSSRLEEPKFIEKVRVYGYLPVDPSLEDTRRRLEESLWYLGRIRPLPLPQFRTVQEADWSEAWKEHYHPLPIGRKLIVIPAWMESPSRGRIPIRIDPGMAFGTGTHPSTQLCLEMIEAHLLPDEGPDQSAQNQPGVQVIDMGCGSGILSIAALKMGAVHALGVDIDPGAISVARRNASMNEITADLELGQGSLPEILAGKFSIRRGHLVLANILAPVIIRMLGSGLGELLHPQGILVLAGILDPQTPEVQSAAQAHGLEIRARRQIDDWVALAVSRIAKTRSG